MGASQLVEQAMIIKKDTKINEIINAHPETVQFFTDLNMSCSQCFAVNFDTLENGALMHDMDADQLIAKLNRFISSLPAAPTVTAYPK
jgi:hybrid cluster-associated redox disulfide protein